MAFKKVIIIFLICLNILTNDLRSTSLFGKTQSTGMMLLEKLKSSPLACALLATMGIKCCIDKLVRLNPVRPFIKSGIKGASYAALGYYMFKNNHTKIALGIAGFGLMDSIATLPISSLSYKVRSFMKKMNKQNEIVRFNNRQITNRGGTIINEDFIQICRLQSNIACTQKLLIPTVEIEKQIKTINDCYTKDSSRLIDERFIYGYYKNLCYDCFETSFGLLQLIKIFNYHNILKQELVKQKCCGLQQECQLSNSYEIIRDLGIRDIMQSYFLQKKQLEKTWNLLPIELITHIFSFLCPYWNNDMQSLIDYFSALVEWKQKKSSIIPKSPVTATSWYNAARLLSSSSVGFTDKPYKRINWNGWNFQIPCKVLQIILNFMRNKGRLEYEWHKGGRKFLHCFARRNKDGIIISNWSDQDYSSDKWVRVKLIHRENSFSDSLEITIAEMMIQLQAVNNKCQEKTIKIDRNLYDALVWLVGNNNQVVLEYEYRKFDNIDEKSIDSYSDLIVIKKIKNKLQVMLEAGHHDQIIRYLVHELAEDKISHAVYNVFFDKKVLLRIYNYNVNFMRKVPMLSNIGTEKFSEQRLLLNELGVWVTKNHALFEALLGVKYIVLANLYPQLSSQYLQLAHAIMDALSGKINQDILHCTHFTEVSPDLQLQEKLLTTICWLLDTSNGYSHQCILALDNLWGKAVKGDAAIMIFLLNYSKEAICMLLNVDALKQKKLISHYY